MGFSSIGAVGAEISEMFTENVTPLSTEVTKIDPSEVGTSYCFTSARGGYVILTILAEGYTTKKLI